MTIQTDGWQFHVEMVHIYRDAMKVVERQTGISQTRLDILHELFHADEISQAELQNRLDIEGAVATRISIDGDHGPQAQDPRDPPQRALVRA